jgi:adenine-specific DNA methylase
VTTYPKRLIEVDLPIKRISVHARREKSIRHGHISTLHIWWARRPLAACRAVICAALWPDPADALCPTAFRDKALAEMLAWTPHDRQKLLSAESCKRFEAARQKPALFKDPVQLRGALLDFIADFANWDNSTVREYLETSRALTQAAHEALGGVRGTRPLVVDPFAGGGSIPLEALRVGTDAFGSDLNPVPVLLNKVVLEYMPKYGKRLADEFRKWGTWIKREAERKLGEFYPNDPDGVTPIAYLWARTILSEAPSDDNIPVEIPVITTFWLSTKRDRKIALRWANDGKNEIRTQVAEKTYADGTTRRIRQPLLEVFEPISDSDVPDGTAQRSSVTCPITGFTVPAGRVRKQFAGRESGARDSRLIAIATKQDGGRGYRTPTQKDFAVLEKAKAALVERIANYTKALPLVPDEELPYLRSIFNIHLLGANKWGHLFTDRQLLALTTLISLIDEIRKRLKLDDAEFNKALLTCLAFIVDKVADKASSLCRWKSSAEYMAGNTFGRQALPIVWDFCEANVIGQATGDIGAEAEWIDKVLLHVSESQLSPGQAESASATNHPLPDDAAQAIFTDPPYYDSVPYADLSDFFYCWLRRSIGQDYPALFEQTAAPKTDEVVQLSERNPKYQYKTKENFEKRMRDSLAEGRRVTQSGGIGIIVFAHKTTAAWETMIQAVIDAGWIVVASWPLDTEMGARLRAQGAAALGSSVHLVCRPRENPDGSMRTDEIGDWRDVLQALPRRIHEWMPRLAEEGVVGADAIFACLGPALEIFSRYSRVEKASGESVTLKEYLEQVWAAVAKEALTMVFQGADATGFEADARLTAMWLWTLQAGDVDAASGESAEEEETEDGSEGVAKKPKAGGFMLEYDAARKIAQGLGAHLEHLGSLVEVSGEQARLLTVGERARYLFGKDEGRVTPQRKKREAQMDLFKVLEQTGGEGMPFGETKVERQGATVLDRIHQSMILFAAGRGEALKRFLVEDGAGRDQRFWRLAQALSALYPSHIEEKRWVDGVLARKKGLGF